MRNACVRRLCVSASVGLAAISTATADDIGLEIADQVDVATWRHYLDDLLYTHAGNNRGINGAHHNLARENIVATFQSFGLAVERDEFVYSGQTYQNIIATKPGRLFPEQAFVIGAHYDSVSNGGADDDGSGVASLLELARIFAQYDTTYTLKFAAWDAEEVGLRGSTAYVAERRDELLRGMIQIDMIAHNAGANRQDIYAGTLATGLRDGLVAAFPLYGHGQGVQINGPAGFSDHAPFDSAQYPAVCFVEDNYQANACYHQPCDNVDTPNHIHYDFAANFVRVIAGYLANQALALHPGDCDGDGTPDADEIAADPALDCNGNGVLDACEPGLAADCNASGTRDLCDIASGASQDRDRNARPDECQATRRVPADYATIQAAITAAAVGDTVLVAPGVYSGAGNVNLNFGGKNLTLRSEAGAAATTIQCGATARGFTFASSEDRRSIVDGFTINEGLGSGGGGAISCTEASPIIRNCKFTNSNAPSVGGGAIYLTRRSRPIIANCTFIGNTTAALGGAILCSNGSSPLVLDSEISLNNANTGGAIACDRTSKPTLRNCTLARNAASNRGGALYMAGADYSSPAFENCIVWGNMAPAGQGLSIYASAGTFVTARYSAIEGGPAGIVGGATVIAWEHCIEQDPQFTNSADHNYTLRAGSPCIDAGSNTLAGLDVADIDFDGNAGEPIPMDHARNARFVDWAAAPDSGEGTAPIVDMGAYEFRGASCTGDLDFDGSITLTDLAIVLSSFSCTPAPLNCAGDLDGDGDVDLADLAALLSVFGTNCP